MIRTYLVRHGNAHALLLDESLLAHAQIDPTRPLQVRADGQRLIVTPLELSKDESFAAALQAVNQVQSNTLKKLAE